jgi:signal transduction histidine kinase
MRRAKIKNEIHDFLFRISEVVIEKEVIKIVTFQDFKKELEEKELASWKKLIRVLTHEIMNSITPITTLSVAVRRIIKPEDKIKDINHLQQDDLEDIFINNTVIEERSKGLLEFMDQYRKLTKIPTLNLEEVKLKTLIEDQQSLFKSIIDQDGIEFQIDISPEDLMVNLDNKLTEQVLINLIKNAIEALDKPRKRIQIYGGKELDYIYIKVVDNGKGIPLDIQDQIFIPFYTTKETGSGIGLSLCREIIQTMKGSIMFESTEGEGSVFWLKFF